MIDIHCHILPGLDDGPDTMEESVLMAECALNEGIDTIIATPHFIKGEINVNINQVNSITNELNICIKERGMDIKVLPGAEVHIDPLLIQVMEHNRLTLNNTSYIMLELPAGIIPTITKDMIYNLLLTGIIPIISHPERNMEIVENPNKLCELIQGGALAQLTCSSLTGRFGRQIKETSIILLTHNMVHFIGTDAHSHMQRKPSMNKAIRIMEELIGKEMTNEIAYENPLKLIEGKLVDINEPIEYEARRRRLSFRRIRNK